MGKDEEDGERREGRRRRGKGGRIDQKKRGV